MKKVMAVVFALGSFILPFQTAIGQDSLGETTVNYNQDARQARINDLKDQYKINLQDNEKLAVTARCKTAQKKLVILSGELAQTTIARRAVYQDNIDSLKRIQSRLLASQIDTSSLDLLTVTYQQKLKSFESTSENYALTIEDAVTLDCTANPEDFRAALEGVRAARKKVVLVTAEIRETTRSSLKTTTDTLTNRLKGVEARQ